MRTWFVSLRQDTWVRGTSSPMLYPKWFNGYILHHFSVLNNVQQLVVDCLDVPSLTLRIRQYFGHFPPTVQSYWDRQSMGPSYIVTWTYERLAQGTRGRSSIKGDGFIAVMEPRFLKAGWPKGRDLLELEDNSLVLFAPLYGGATLLPPDNDGSDSGIENTVSPCTSSAFAGLDGMARQNSRIKTF